MASLAPNVDLGSVSARVPPGAHVCHIYSDNTERNNALLQFLVRGLRANESTACFSENLDPVALKSRFEEEGVSLDREMQSGRFMYSGAEAVYFKDGYFDPDRMLSLLVHFYETAVADGRSGARVIGEMSSAITKIPGGSRLFEYEARVNGMIREYPVSAICQYDARAFDGATIMDVLAVHPFMVVNGNVIQNPFFLPAESYGSR